MHFTLSGAGLSIMTGFIYRYYSLKGELDFFHKKRMIGIIGLMVLLYPVPCLIPNWIQYRYSERDSQIWVEENYPELLYIYTHWTCSGFYDLDCLIASIVVAMIQILIIGHFSAHYFKRSILLLRTLKQSLPVTSYALQKQLLIVLCLQIMLPFFFLVLPLTILFSAMLAGSTNMTCKYSF